MALDFFAALRAVVTIKLYHEDLRCVTTCPSCPGGPAGPEGTRPQGTDHRHEETEDGLVVGGGQDTIKQVYHIAEEDSKFDLREIVHKITS